MENILKEFKPIGEVFVYDGVRLIVERGTSRHCNGCYFYARCCDIVATGTCAGGFRDDRANVIFKQTEQ